MKITILDGQDKKENRQWAAYMQKLVAQLEDKGHDVNHVVLMDKKIHSCTGCFGCWVKTPGTCVIADDSQEINRKVIQSDFVLWASPLVMGFPSAYLKHKMDRTIPLIHPYFVVVNNEAHHRSRYDKYPVFGLLVQPDKADSAENVNVIKRIFARTALNIKSWLAFAETTNLDVSEVVSLIDDAQHRKFEIQELERLEELTSVQAHKRLLVINGSPRGKGGNTPVMLQKFMDGFLSREGTSAEMIHLVSSKDKQALEKAYQKADCVILGFPLYTDAMPGMDKDFMEFLGRFEGRKDNPAMAFLVQSGFPEAAHSRYVERYLQVLAARLDSPYLGSLIRGGCEGVRLMPESMNRKMFATLTQLGEQLADEGSFSQETIKALAGVEKYPKVLMPLMKVLVKLPVTQMYWNGQLKENQVYERRFDRPYQEIRA